LKAGAAASTPQPWATQGEIMRKRKRNSQSGWIGLIVLLVSMAIFLTISSEAIPIFIQTQRNMEYVAAKQRVRSFGNMMAAIAICQGTSGCVVNPALTALVPVSGSVVQQGAYSYAFNVSGSTYTYVATPTGSAFSGNGYVQVTQTNVVQCRWGAVGGYVNC
jgi:hypothetical protein